jgi:tetratricopeptide (TPR) repeat protein
MTDELIATLAKIGSLRVISRTSAMQYKRTKKPLPQIGQELNVDAVVEGTVLRSGDRVRITANLLHAPTDRHLWAESYESELRDVLVLQGEVARAIATAIQIKLSSQEEARLTVARPVNPEAYEAYLKGNYARGRGFVGAASAIQYFHRAIATDPGYAQPYVGLCLTYANMTGGLGFLPPRESFAQMNQAALKALELDATLGEAHTCLAWGKAFGEWDWAGGERDFKQAIELSPSSPEAHAWYSLFLSAMGRHEEAIAESKRALELDPVSPGASDRVAGAYWWARQYERAATESEKVIQMDPTYPGAQQTRGLVYLTTGSYDEAIHRFQRAIALFEQDPPTWYVGVLGCAYGRAGKRAEALEILHELESRSKHQYVSPYLVANLLANMNYKDRAFQYLEKAYAERNPMLAFLRVEPVIDPLRSDPRFQALLRRMNFPP